MTTAEKILKEFKREIYFAITVPNSYLPEEFQNHTTGCRSLGNLKMMCDKRDNKISEHQKIKQIKARNIEKLAKQVEEFSRYKNHGDFVDLDRGLDYTNCEINHEQLYKNECAMVNGMVNSGMISEDDLLEE